MISYLNPFMSASSNLRLFENAARKNPRQNLFYSKCSGPDQSRTFQQRQMIVMKHQKFVINTLFSMSSLH